MIVRKLQVANLLLEPYFGYLFCHHFKPVAKKLAAQVWLMAFLYYRKSTFSGLLSVTARTSDGHLGLRGSINWGWGQFSIGQRRSIARRGRRVVSGFYEAGNCDSRLYWQKETTTYYFWYSKQNDIVAAKQKWGNNHRISLGQSFALSLFCHFWTAQNDSLETFLLPLFPPTDIKL